MKNFMELEEPFQKADEPDHAGKTHMRIRNAKPWELDRIMEIYELARGYMAKNGNPGQWTGGYPQPEVVQRDMEQGNCYVCETNRKIVGVFTFFTGEEPSYRQIEKGEWHRMEPYGTIHRVASDGSVRGLAAACFAFCREKCSYLRIDTHRANLPMQRALKQFGFRPCGIVHVEDGTERIAFDYEAEEKNEPEEKDKAGGRP